MVKPIKRVLLKHPKEAYQNQKKINDESLNLKYLANPNFNKACTDYDQFTRVLESFNCEINYLPLNNNSSIDSIYTHDPCIISNKGVILSKMGKSQRESESFEIKKFFESVNIPILGQIESPGILEGGDVVWINEKTVAVGEGYRTNKEGILQLKAILGDLIHEIISVPLPHWTGSNDCLHLMSNLSPIDTNLFLVYSRLLPVPFRKYLIQKKIILIEVPDEEYASMGCNVLAIRPRKVLMMEGNPITKKRLEAYNVDVHVYDGTEISLKGSGGPTCLTRPFYRAD